jgi:hypothetical protein
LLRGLVRIAAKGQQHGATAGEIHLHAYFLAIAAARGHQLAIDPLGLENVGRKS